MPPKLGVIAGGGPLPLRVVEKCRQDERAVFAVVLEGQADAADYAKTDHVALRLGAAGTAIKRLRAEGCETLVLAGWVRRPSLSELRPDWWAVKFFAASGADALGDDGLLKALLRALEKEGFNVIGADEIVPELLMPEGVVGSIEPAPEMQTDIAAAVAAARDLGRRDIGQGAVVRDGDVIAAERADGTDAMLSRLAEAGNKGGVLAKVLKPGQERRVDLPTVGPETVRNAARAGLAGIVIDAGNAFLMDAEATRAAADGASLFILGVAADEAAL
jgi:DUF1009 family protein